MYEQKKMVKKTGLLLEVFSCLYKSTLPLECFEGGETSGLLLCDICSAFRSQLDRCTRRTSRV